MNIVLGTVQFGLPYGVTNRKGQVHYEEVLNILDAAYKCGITTLDTAKTYGNCESILGKASKKLGVNFNYITKTLKLVKSASSRSTFMKGIDESLNCLNCNYLYGLMIHDANDLLTINSGWTYGAVSKYKDHGLVKNIGVSVYSPDQLELILDKYSIDIVQLPLNIFDRRFLPILNQLKESNIKIYARSIFLQGLLLDYSCLPANLKKFRGYFDNYHDFLMDNKLTPLEASLNFVNKYVDNIVVGVTNKRELDQITSIEPKVINYPEYKDMPELLIDPRLW